MNCLPSKTLKFRNLAKLGFNTAGSSYSTLLDLFAVPESLDEDIGVACYVTLAKTIWKDGKLFSHLHDGTCLKLLRKGYEELL